MARLGFELRAVVLDAVCGYGKLGVLRIQRRQQLATEWAKSTMAAAFATAGVRWGGEKGYDALEEERVVATSSWCCAEHKSEVGFEPLWL